MKQINKSGCEFILSDNQPLIFPFRKNESKISVPILRTKCLLFGSAGVSIYIYVDYRYAMAAVL
jgi:hypothetical protein